MIDKLTADWEGAVIILRPKDGGAPMVRPAAFVFDWTGGFAWLEPSYADPDGTPAPAWHEVEASVIEEKGGEIVFDGPRYSGDIEWYVGQMEVAPALDWFAGWLAENGRSWADERARVVADLLPD